MLTEVASELPLSMLEAVLRDAARSPATLPTLLSIVQRMDDGGQRTLIAVIDAADRQVGVDLVNALANPAQAAGWLQQMPAEVQAAVTRAAVRFDMKDTLDQALAHLP
jgi:hypothetical protein